MKLISLEEFQRSAALSDKSLVWLLTKNLIRCESSPEGKLLVDVESVDYAVLREAILARQNSVVAQNKEIIVERLGNVVRDELQVIVDQAIGQYLSEENA